MTVHLQASPTLIFKGFKVNPSQCGKYRHAGLPPVCAKQALPGSGGPVLSSIA